MTTPRTVHRDPAAPRRRLTHSSPKRLSGVWAPVIWEVVGGAPVAASPLGFWWLPSATVYACGLILIASVYIGFSVADGRGNVTAVATTFVVLAAMAITGPAWLIVAGPTAHGIKASDATERGSSQHTMVATVPRHHRLGRRRHLGRRDSNRRRSRMTPGMQSLQNGGWTLADAVVKSTADPQVAATERA